jgi:hypothetical protein
VLSLIQAGFLAGNWAKFFLVLIVLLSSLSIFLGKKLYYRRRRNNRSSTLTSTDVGISGHSQVPDTGQEVNG